jgi:hypothetical protein
MAESRSGARKVQGQGELVSWARKKKKAEKLMMPYQKDQGANMNRYR